MLRTIFVLAIFGVGAFYALREPFYALLLYLWIAYFRPEHWVWHDFVRSLPLSYYTGLYLVGSTLFRGPLLRFDVRSLLLFALLGHSFLSTLRSPYSAYGFPYWVEFAKSTIVTYLIALLCADRKRFRAATLVIALSLGLEAAKQGWVDLVSRPGARNENNLPLLGDNNGVAIGMLMLFPLLVALFRTSDRRWEKALLGLIAAGCLYRSVTTYSRGGFLALAALALIHLVRTPRKLPILAGVAAFGLAVLSIMPQTFWERMRTISLSTQPTDASAAGRLHFWRVALDMAGGSPLSGVGHKAYQPAYDAYDFSRGEFGRERACHSAWFETLSELGYPGLLLFAANVLLALRAAYRVRRLAEEDPGLADVGHFAVGLEAALVVFFVGGSFVNFAYNEMLWHTIGLTMALEAIAAHSVAAREAGVASPGPLAPAPAGGASVPEDAIRA